MSVFYPTDSVVVMPNPGPQSVSKTTFENARKYCNELDGYRMPNIEELMSIFVNNRKFIGTTTNANYWSSKTYEKDTNSVYYVFMENGTINIADKNASMYSSCVKR